MNILNFLAIFVSFILGCDFGDIRLEATNPRLAIVELDDGSTFVFVIKSSKTSTDAPLP